jgi:hypothetical protein
MSSFVVALARTVSPALASVLESAVSAISGLASISTWGAAGSEACWVSINGDVSDFEMVLSVIGGLIALYQSRPRMIAVGTSETIMEATRSARLLLRVGLGTKSWSLCGSMKARADSALRLFGAFGAKRSAIASGSAGVSTARRSIRLLGRMTESDWLRADSPM